MIGKTIGPCRVLDQLGEGGPAPLFAGLGHSANPGEVSPKLSRDDDDR